MSITWLSTECSYDGTQLCTDFIKQHGSGSDDEIVLFLGPADVPVEHLVDLEDAAANAVIQSPMMAHVLLEHRGVPLTEMVWRQRMLGRIASSWIVWTETSRVPASRCRTSNPSRLNLAVS